MEKRLVGRPKKDGKYINCYCDSELVDKLNEFSANNGVSKTVAIERALMMYFDSFNKNNNTKGRDQL